MSEDSLLERVTAVAEERHLSQNRGEDTKRNLKHVKGPARRSWPSGPAGQFGDEDYVDLADLRQCQDLLLCPGGVSLPDPDAFVASLFGEGAQVPFLAGTGLVGD